jgi:hypothetical protein
VPQPGRQVLLVDEHLREVRVGAVRGQHALDRHGPGKALGADRLREEDLGHAAAAEAADELVLADAGGGHGQS